MTEKLEDIFAFPRPMHFDPNRQETIDYGEAGMMLRDYFAAAALPKLNFIINGDAITATQQKAVAEYCYSIADAMLVARQK